MSRSKQTCTECGTALPAGALAGLCPKCVAAAVGLESSRDLSDLVVALPGRHESPSGSGSLDIGQELAHGGMGVVYEATDSLIGRAVAVKFLRGERENDPNAIGRFVQEGQIAGRLQHPGIVPVYQLGFTAEGRPYYAMRHIEGESLASLLERIRRQDESALAQYPMVVLLGIFQKICDAVAYAHSQGVIHRDLKPENVMIGSFGEVLVLDWGLAKVLEVEQPQSSGDDLASQCADRSQTTELTAEPSDPKVSSEPPGALPSDVLKPSTETSKNFRTLEGSILGTPGAMAPEQAAGQTESADARTDVFGLGGVLYRILTLRPPAGGTTVHEVLQNTQRGYIPPPTYYNRPREINPDGTRAERIRLAHLPGGRVPGALSAVAMRALATRPEERYQSVPELQKDIDAFRNDFATAAEQAGLHRLITLWLRRHRAASAALAFVGLLTAALMAQTLASRARINATLHELRAMSPHFAEKSHDLVSKLNFKEALVAANRAIELDPEMAEFHVLKGNILESLLRFQDAATAYTKALKLDSAQSVASENLRLCQELLQFNTPDMQLSVLNLGRLRETMYREERFEEAQAMKQRQLAKDKELRTVHLKKWRDHLDQVGVKGTLTVTDEGMLALDLSYSSFENLSLLKDVPINQLKLVNNKVKDLNALKRMPLRALTLQQAPIQDIRPLRGMQLESLELYLEPEVTTDLSPLKGMPLKRLFVASAKDIRPLKGLPLVELSLTWSTVSDLGPLLGMPLENLRLSQAPNVVDLHPLAGMPLRILYLDETKVSDLSPLQGMPLVQLDVSKTRVTNVESLLTMTALTHLGLGGLPIADVSLLEGKQLVDLNLSGTVVTNLGPLKGMPLQSLDLSRTQVSDLQPLIGMKNLQVLSLNYTKVTNLEPLRFFPLTHLELAGTPVRDLSPLNRLSLDTLQLSDTKVNDLAPLKGLPLGNVLLANTEILDLQPLAGAPIATLDLSGTKISDLSPLRSMALHQLLLHDCLKLEDLSPLSACTNLEQITLPLQCRNIEFLRKLPNVRLISYGNTDKIAADFWKEFDQRNAAAQKP